MSKKIRIEDYYDGFAIFIGDDCKFEQYHIDQEEPAGERLVEVFEALGHEVEYEDVY